jgi:cytoskeleton protein RodZ
MMESPGKSLRKERETRNISLEEISGFTKIKERHLKAIEEDKYELLPPPLYVKGYLNTYAKYVGLNPKDIVLQYENYLKSLLPPEPVELQHQAPPPKKRVRSWFFISLIFAGIFITLFFISYSGRHPVEKKPKTISSSSNPYSSAIHQGAKAQTIYTARQERFSEPEKTEVDPSALQAEGQGLPPIRAARLSPSRASGSSDPPKSLAEGTACLPQAGVDPDRHSPAPSSRTGLGAAEWINDVTTQQAPAFQVLEADIGRGIEKEGGRQSLTGKCSEFTSDNQRAYFFTRIKTPTARKITHIWLWKGKEYYQTEIDVKPPAWSVYSYCTFRHQHTGDWKAEVRDGDQVLTSLDFRVVQSAGDQSL